MKDHEPTGNLSSRTWALRRAPVPTLSACSGLSTLELLVGLIISAVVFMLFSLAYKGLTKDNQNLKSVTDIQREVKTMSRELQGDLGRAGFGLTGVVVFPTLKTTEIRFLYRDLLGTACLATDTAAITYTAGPSSLTRNLSCAGTTKVAKVFNINPDSLNLAFRYLDKTGSPTTVSADIRTVEFTLEVVAKPSAKNSVTSRITKGSVSVVNNS